MKKYNVLFNVVSVYNLLNPKTQQLLIKRAGAKCKTAEKRVEIEEAQQASINASLTGDGQPLSYLRLEGSIDFSQADGQGFLALLKQLVVKGEPLPFNAGFTPAEALVSIEAGESLVFSMSLSDMTNFALSAGLVMDEREMTKPLSKALREATALFNFEFAAKDDEFIGAEGTGTITKSHWRSEVKRVKLSSDGQTYLDSVIDELDEELVTLPTAKAVAKAKAPVDPRLSSDVVKYLVDEGYNVDEVLLGKIKPKYFKSFADTDQPAVVADLTKAGIVI